MPETPLSISVASLKTHRLILAAANDGSVEISSNLPRPAIAKALRTLADHFAAPQEDVKPGLGPQLTQEEVDKIRARHAAAEGGGWHLAPEPDAEPDTVRTTVSGYQCTIGVFDFRGGPTTADANRAFVLSAHDDIALLLRDRDRYADRADMAARIGELELALSSAADWLRNASMHLNGGTRPTDTDRYENAAAELNRIRWATTSEETTR